MNYLCTPSVEAIVHGCDVVPPVRPDEEALQIAAEALIDTLRAQRPDLVPGARALPIMEWVDQATGRAQPAGLFIGVLPLVS